MGRDSAKHGGGCSPALVGAAALAGTALAVGLASRRAERAHPPLGRFLDVDGVRLHYLDRGAGRPVVVLHGNLMMAEEVALGGLLDRLAERYRVIAFGRPRLRLQHAATRPDLEPVGAGGPDPRGAAEAGSGAARGGRAFLRHHRRGRGGAASPGSGRRARLVVGLLLPDGPGRRAAVVAAGSARAGRSVASYGFAPARAAELAGDPPAPVRAGGGDAGVRRAAPA